MRGPTFDDVPLAESFRASACVLRANAHEKREDVGAAIYELCRGMTQLPNGAQRIEKHIAQMGALAPCRRSYGPARQQAEVESPVAPRRLMSSRSIALAIIAGSCLLIAIALGGGVQVGGFRLDILFLGLGLAFLVPVVAGLVRRSA